MDVRNSLGEYLDETTGFFYLRARDYGPLSQLFLTEDSYSWKVSETLSLNLYAYCLGNPIRYSDPSVHESEEDKTIRRRGN